MAQIKRLIPDLEGPLDPELPFAPVSQAGWSVLPQATFAAGTGSSCGKTTRILRISTLIGPARGLSWRCLAKFFEDLLVSHVSL